eukprot:88568_1
MQSPPNVIQHAAINAPLLSTDEEDVFEWKYLECTSTKFQKETRTILNLGIPLGFYTMTQIIQLFTDQSVVGHLGTDYLAAAALAAVIMSFPATYMMSFCEAISVLCSQAFGTENKQRVSEWLQLGCLLTAILSIPTCIIYAFSENILLIFGVNSHIAHLSGQFTTLSIISVIPGTWFYALSTYFKAQSIVLPTTVICAVMIIVNLVINLVIVYGYGIDYIVYKFNGHHWNGFGFIGSPIATAITRTIQFIVYIIYMFYYKQYHIINKTWSPFKADTFSWKRIKIFLSVALPQSIGIALEEWSFQIITLFTAKLANADVAAFASMGTMVMIGHCWSFGIASSVTVRVGNLLGANNPKEAKYISYVGIIIALISGLIVGGLIASIGKYTAYIVSGQHDIYVLYRDSCPILGLALGVLTVIEIFGGVLTAQARTTVMAIGVLIGCWGVSVTLSYVLGVHLGYGVTAIWWSIFAGYIVFGIPTSIVFFTSNWGKCAKDAVNRNLEHIK